MDFARLRCHGAGVATDAERLGAAIKAARGSRSVRSVAREIGLSEGRWRQVENGYQSAGQGHKIAVHPKATTLEAMAKAVGLNPIEALRIVGREDEAAVASEPVPGDPRPVGLGRAVPY